MKTLAFIPARGGSKRLPGKNGKLFAGKPLLWYSIAFAKYNALTRIIVSTDDQSLADIATSSGAEVLWRPAELSSDSATTASAASHCLNAMEGERFYPEVFITLQPTNPLRPQNLFHEALGKYNARECDSVIAVGRNKYKYGRVADDAYAPLNYNPGTRSQDLQPLFYENGLIYLTRPAVIKQNEIFGEKILTVETAELYSGFDIDTQLDFEIAEHVFLTHPTEFNYLR